jgi:AraC family transcriptional regulator
MNLETPRLERLHDLNLIGISRHYPFESVAEIPNQWQSYVPLIPQAISDPSPVTYGAIYNGADESFGYLSGVELPRGKSAPQNMVSLLLAAQSYLVFRHPGHVATLRDTCSAIWTDWLPASGRSVVEAPWFERYGDEFDPVTGNGGLEIWIPISA